LDDCHLESHHDCTVEECEVKRKLVKLADAQVEVGRLTAISGIAVSSSMAFGILYVWVWSVLHGQPMPDIPWVISSIVGATFTAGTLTAWKAQKKEKPNE
jgi:hypothetical protein